MVTKRHSQYDYVTPRSIYHAENVDDAIQITVWNYMHDQLGWSDEACHQRVTIERDRVIPKGILSQLEKRGWDFEHKLVLDLGAGQGGMVHELLLRGIEAFGIEPGDEFAFMVALRLNSIDLPASRIVKAYGEQLPFADNSLDFVICLQVLEHVRHPNAVIEEIFRVLKPGGCCYVSCENYLSFFEPHYRIKWFPMLPKFLGSIYLKMLHRNPDFLNNYIFYTTYPQIWLLFWKVGFKNCTYSLDDDLQKIRHPNTIQQPLVRQVSRLVNFLLPDTQVLRKPILIYRHLQHLFRRGLAIYAQKPI